MGKEVLIMFLTFKILKLVGKILGLVLGPILLLALLFFGYLCITEYSPDEREAVAVTSPQQALTSPSVGESFTVYSWNIGYSGLGEESDFFMDGGEMVDPPSQEAVEKNFAGILNFMQNTEADAWLLQEVDRDSSRSDGMDQYAALSEKIPSASSFALNYKCAFVPFPLPPIGGVESGLATLSARNLAQDATRVSLPCPFSWPVRVAQLKRCLLINRIPLADSDKQIVLVNLHLEAYDDGEGKIAQTKLLLQVLEEEYAKGNYVIAGGDFNQLFPGTEALYPIAEPEKWLPGQLEASQLPEGWQFAFDAATPTCRLLDRPYTEDCQKYVIDGFLVSPNVTVSTVKTQDLGFRFSDHNPVALTVTFAP